MTTINQRFLIDNIESQELQELLENYIVGILDDTDYVTWRIDRTPNWTAVLRTVLPNRDIQFIVDNYHVFTKEELYCCICFEVKETKHICLLNCGHTFCEICVNNCINLPQQYNCSLCREKVTIIKKHK